MTENAVEIRGLEKSFPRFHLGPLDMTVKKGAVYGLIGPNGAGKTTTLDLIMGMGRKDKGEIRILGLDHLKDEVEMKRRVGYVSPDLDFESWGRVQRVVSFIRGFYSNWDDDYCRNLIESLKLPWKEKVSNLSFGNKIKLALVLGLSHRPEVLLLDEPFVGLDAVSKKQIFNEILSVVQDEERTVVISSHNLSDLERFSDHFGLIKEGRMILEGSTADLLDRYRMVEFTTQNGTALEPAPGFHPQTTADHRRQALLDIETFPPSRLTDMGATDIVESRVTLEELFVALVGEG
ncbi:MAG: ABC transporter ATP-binding protein [Candidatus Omnitrophica bacterium]|nr:ABC transporter ATP-binding protein [Candidatus Omnitrophota bacterium]